MVIFKYIKINILWILRRQVVLRVILSNTILRVAIRKTILRVFIRNAYFTGGYQPDNPSVEALGDYQSDNPSVEACWVGLRPVQNPPCES